jgi:hypothetical protein
MTRTSQCAEKTARGPSASARATCLSDACLASNEERSLRPFCVHDLLQDYGIIVVVVYIQEDPKIPTHFKKRVVLLKTPIFFHLLN